MGEAVLSAVVEGVVSKATSVAIQHINLGWGFEEELEKLGYSLPIIRALLQDAEERQRNDKPVKLWLDKLRDVAYEADDVLDEFTYEILRRKVEIRDQIRRKVLYFFSPSNPILFRLKMDKKIKDIHKSLDGLNKLADQLGLQQRAIDVTPVLGASNEETVSFLDDSKIVGRKDDVSKAGSSGRTEICNVRHLNVIDYRESLPTVLTSAAPKLHSLFSKIDVFQKRFMRCWSLTLPDGLRNLISLRHIHFDHETLQPVEIGHLTSLQTLTMFIVGLEKGRLIEELKCLDELCGELKICKLERVRDKEEAMRANLLHKTKLCKLIFEWSSAKDSYGNTEEVLEGLRPHSNLHSLIIRNYAGENFPSWIVRSVAGSSTLFLLNNLMELELIECRRCKSLPTLGHLPSLKILKLKKLKSVKCITSEFYYNNSSHGKGAAITLFPALEKFTLDHMTKLEEWAIADSATTTAFPCLEELNILWCPVLKSVPITRHPSSLRKLHIEWCEELSNIAEELSASKCLKELIIEGCSELSSIPDLEGFSSLVNLELVHCDKLESVPLMGRCSTLQKFHIEECRKLIDIRDGLSCSTRLKRLFIKSCPNLSSVPDLEAFSSLESLEVFCCDKLERLPIMGRCSSLQTFHIGRCEKLNKIGDALSNSPCLESLVIEDCGYLSSVPRLDGLFSLKELIVCHCPQLTNFQITGEFSSLGELRIENCRELSCIGDGLSTSTRLQKLSIRLCPKLSSIQPIDGLSSLRGLDFTESGQDLTCVLPSLLQFNNCLRELTISGFSNLTSIPENLGKLHSLVYLNITWCPKLRCIPEDILGYLTHLERLRIGGFSEELEEFPGLSSVQHLQASLEYLHLIGWEKLKSLPPQLQCLTALKKLRIERYLSPGLVQLLSLLEVGNADCVLRKHVNWKCL
ncbi:hypothetical protein QUC31_017162 [Theobroma cacao]